MPTSPTDRRRGGGEGGFTLLELLVVVTIIGLLSAAVVLAAPAGGTSLREEAERLAARARAAQEHAILSNRAVALRLTETGYAFTVRRGGAWTEAASPAAARWEEGTRVEPAGRILFESTGPAEPVLLVLTRDGERLGIDLAGDGGVHVRQPS